MAVVAIAVGASAAIAAGASAYSASQQAGAAENTAEAQAAQTSVAQQQQDIANQIFGETAGLRTRGINQLERFQRTGRLPIALPTKDLYQQGRGDLEKQYQVVREQLLSETPLQGGQLNQSLSNLAMSRAGAVGGLRTNIRSQIEFPLRERLFQTGLTIGMGGVPTAISGLQGAGAQYGNIAGVQGQLAMGYGQQASQQLGQFTNSLEDMALMQMLFGQGGTGVGGSGAAGVGAGASASGTLGW